MPEVIKFRNLKEHDCPTVAECRRVLPPLPSLHVLLGYAATLGSCNSKEGPRNSVTSRATVHDAAFSAGRIPALIGETEGSAAPVKVK
jgi:hypothetical protein